MQIVGNPNPQAAHADHQTQAPHLPHPRAVFLVVTAAVFVSNLDLFIVNVALPSMNQRFHGSTLAGLSWVLNGYAIVFAALLVPAGRLADRIGHRAAFLAGLALFTLSSALCALAPGVGWLVGARLLQAVGAALLMPTSLALLLDATEPQRRPAAVRVWASIGGIAAGLGPVLGGLLVEADWRWVFLVNLPVGVAALVAGARVLPRLRGRGAEPWPDLAGALLLTAAIAALAVGLVKSDAWGWGSPRVLGCLAAAAVLTLGFLLRSARHPAPVVELPLLRVPVFAAANATALLFTVAFAGMLLTSVLWCQQVWGYSALRTGLAVAPGPLLVPPIALTAGPLLRRLGHGRLSALGLLCFGAGIAWWAAAIGTAPGYAGELLPGMLLTGAGVGLTLPTLIGAAAAALPPTRFATGSAVTTMGRQIGAVVGVAVVVSLLGTPHSAQQALGAFRHAWWAVLVATGLALAGSIVLATVQQRQSPTPSENPSTSTTPSTNPTPTPGRP
ncbi:MFS transporter [Kitasatospora azatica]|uniref:MFS transporter n=1 Tax=Kitasatospora azatica TaxID=58347 RepID=UPI0009FE4F20|nr:MFS transporter [Kitasatospora azatica]